MKDISNLLVDDKTSFRKTILIEPEFRAPKCREFIRVKPMILKDKIICLTFLNDDLPPYQTWAINPRLAVEFSDKVFKARVYLIQNKQGEIFIWPIRTKKHHINKFHQEMAKMAADSWVAKKKTNNNGFEILTSTGDNTVNWPDIKPIDLLKRALENHSITDTNHPILKRWQGM